MYAEPGTLRTDDAAMRGWRVRSGWPAVRCRGWRPGKLGKADLEAATNEMDVEQLTETEVAEIAGTPVDTVKSRTGRTRRELRNQLEAYAKEMGFVGRNR